MNIELKRIGDHRVIQVSGELDLYNVGELKRALFRLTDGRCHSVIVDMENVSYTDSSGIGALVLGQKKMKSHNGTFAIMNPHENVLNLLRMSTLDKFFKIYTSEDSLRHI